METGSNITAPTSITSVPNDHRRGDIIDFFVLKNMNSTVPETIFELTSDHYPVQIEIATSPTEFKRQTKPHTN
jgi:hypothetical protein